MTTRTTLKTYFERGDKPTAAQFAALIDSAFNLTDDTENSIQAEDFSSLAGDLWDGTNKELILTCNREIWFAAEPDLAKLIVTQDEVGGWTLQINGVDIAIDDTADAITVIELKRRASGGYFVTKDISYKPVGDAVAAIIPTIVSIEATDANTIVVTFSAAVKGTAAGWSFDNGSPLTIAGVTGEYTSIWTFTVEEDMLSSDTITFDYDAVTGDVVETIFETALLADDSGAVTNSITALPVDLTYSTSAQTTESPTGTYTMLQTPSVNGARMLADEALAGDGFVQEEIVDHNKEWMLMILDNHNANDPYTTPWDVYIAVVDSGGFKRYQYGEGAWSGLTDTGVTAVDGDLLRLIRAGSTIKAQYYRSGSWTDLHTYSGTYSATMYSKFAFLGGGTPATSICYNPKGLGFA